jgi:hypothetical protein
MPAAESVEIEAAGLCADCANAQKITSERGSNFVLCRLSFRDPRFAKYPRLPVLACDGYKKLDAMQADETDPAK